MPREDDGTPALRDLRLRIALLEAALRDKEDIEERLRTSEERFRSIVETTLVGVWVLDCEGRTTFVNQRAAEMLGYEPAEMLGQPAMQFILGEDLPAHRAAIACRHDGQRETYERRFRRKDGRAIWAIVNGTPMMSQTGEFIASFATLTDITERKEAEGRLHALVELLDTAPNSITVHDREGRFLYANRRTFEIHGCSESEFMAKNLRDVDVPESAALIAERMRLVAEQGEARFEVWHFRSDGTQVPLEVVVRETLWGDKPVHLSVATDITERKRAEAALSLQLDELRRWHAATLGREKRIAELKREVNELAERLGVPPPYAAAADGGPSEDT